MPLQIRRGSSNDRIAITPLVGELIYDTEQKKLYIGDGSTAGGMSAGTVSETDVKDISASLFTEGSHSNISFVYDSDNGKIDASIDLTSYDGAITATNGFRGSLFANDTTALVDATLKSFQLNGTIRTDVVPFADRIYDLGSNEYRFNDLYLGGDNLYLNNALITATGFVVDLPSGSTVGGEPINAGSGVIPGESYEINILDFSGNKLVDADSSTINALGGVFGDLTGSVISRSSDILLDADLNLLLADVENSFIQTSNMLLEDQGEGSGIKIRTTLPNSNYDIFSIEMANNTPIPNSAFFLTGRGTLDEPEALFSNQRIFNFTWAGFDLNNQFSVTSQIEVSVDGDNLSTGVPGLFQIRTNDQSGVLRLGLSIDSNQVLGLSDSNILTAGGGSGQVDDTAPVSFVKIKVGSTEYALPLFAINP